MADITVTTNGPGLRDFDKILQALSTTNVYVGIPAEKSSRAGDTPNNAELMFIHTNGSPKLRIPARPTIEPAVQENQHRIQALLSEAAAHAVKGDMTGFERALDDAGTLAEQKAVEKFGSSSLAPNSGITVHGGWMRNRISGKPFFVEAKGSDAPLIDTGSLRSSITHVIERS